MSEIFARAEDIVARFFRERRDDPSQGSIEIHGERYILVRAASLSLEFFDLVRSLYAEAERAEADVFARSILFDLAHSIGKSDALNFAAKMELTDPVGRLSAGPVHFAHAGWASVDIFPESIATPDSEFMFVYEHPYSFESEAWVRAGRREAFPVCIMNAGYSSGWCEESFGVKLVSVEILCRGRGDECCRFLMAPPDRIDGRLAEYVARNPLLAEKVAGIRIPDFFARKREEESLKRRHGELEKELRQSQKLEALGRLAGGIAHDFNNLLSIVIGKSHLLQAGIPVGDPLREGLAEITLAGERAAALTQQLLAFGRAQVARREELEINTVVSDLAKMLVPLLRDDVQTSLRLAPDAGVVVADRSQLEQVLMNLAINARDAMPNGGRLEIRTAREGDDRVALEVTDTGVGMDDATQGRAFEPFFTTKGELGSGLGLSTVYGIVTQAGGSIGLTSAPGRGTTIRIALPRHDALSLRAEPPSSQPRPRQSVDILLVEDRADVRALLMETLRAIGHRPRATAGGEEAIGLLSDPSFAIDVLVTDVVMPQIGGVELAARARAIRPGLRVLFMSGYADDPRDRELLSANVSEFLQKPFSLDELAAKLDALLQV